MLESQLKIFYMKKVIMKRTIKYILYSTSAWRISLPQEISHGKMHEIKLGECTPFYVIHFPLLFSFNEYSLLVH